MGSESERTYAGGVDSALLENWTDAGPSFGDGNIWGDGNKGT